MPLLLRRRRTVLECLLDCPQEEDLKQLAARVLAPIQPQAVIITGDLVDSKTREARGQQFEEEWQVLRSYARPKSSPDSSKDDT